MKPRTVIAVTALVLAVLPAQAFAGKAHLDLSFGDDGVFVRPPSPEQASGASDLALAPDGQIVVLGSRYVSGVQGSATAFGFDADGRTNPNFGGPDPGATDLVAGSGYARSLGFADGKLLVATVAYTDSGPPSIRLIRLLPDGGLDPTFGSNGVIDTGLVTYGGLYATRMADGRIVLATTGPTQRNYAFPDMMVARLLPDGTPDPSFSEDGTVLVTYPGSEYTSEGPLVVLKNGDVVVAASATIKHGTADYRTRSVLIKFSSSGTLKPGFGKGGFAQAPDGHFITDLAIRRGGDLVAVGSGGTDSLGVDYRPEAIVFKKGGGREKSFGKKGIATVPKAGFGALSAVIVQRSGAILAAGSGNAPSYDMLEEGGDGGDALLVRLKSNGKRDRTFARGGVVTADVRSGTEALVGLGIQAGGRIVAAGTHGYYYFRGPTDQQAMVMGYTRGPQGRR
jgi:uncharacterized delta-60 repeat protein